MGMNQTPDEIIAQYRAALAELYGEKVAKTCDMSYQRGWYYISSLRLTQNRTVYFASVADAFRGKAVQEMTQKLREQAKFRANAKKE